MYIYSNKNINYQSFDKLADFIVKFPQTIDSFSRLEIEWLTGFEIYLILNFHPHLFDRFTESDIDKINNTYICLLLKTHPNLIFKLTNEQMCKLSLSKLIEIVGGC